MEDLCLGILLPCWDNQMKHIVSGLVDMNLHEFKCFIDVPVRWAEVSVCKTFPMCDAVSPMVETLLSVPGQSSMVLTIGVHFMYIAKQYILWSWRILLAQPFSIVIILIMELSLIPGLPTLVGYLLLDFFMCEESFFFSVCCGFENCENAMKHSVFSCTQALVQSILPWGMEFF